jgi:DNA-binding transcriptional regulator YiaG
MTQTTLDRGRLAGDIKAYMAKHNLDEPSMAHLLKLAPGKVRSLAEGRVTKVKPPQWQRIQDVLSQSPDPQIDRQASLRTTLLQRIRENHDLPSTFAKRLGISEEHLNKFTQGQVYLSPQEHETVLHAVMDDAGHPEEPPGISPIIQNLRDKWDIPDTYVQARKTIQHWASSYQVSVRALSEHMGMDYNRLNYLIYREGNPREAERDIVIGQASNPTVPRLPPLPEQLNSLVSSGRSLDDLATTLNTPKETLQGIMDGQAPANWKQALRIREVLSVSKAKTKTSRKSRTPKGQFSLTDLEAVFGISNKTLLKWLKALEEPTKATGAKGKRLYDQATVDLITRFVSLKGTHHNLDDRAAAARAQIPAEPAPTVTPAQEATRTPKKAPPATAEGLPAGTEALISALRGEFQEMLGAFERRVMTALIQQRLSTPLYLPPTVGIPR